MGADWMKNLRRAAANLSISVLAVLVTLILLEIGLRLMFPGEVIIGFIPLWAPDPVLGWRFEPDRHLKVWTARVVVRVSTNSHGWRDVEHAMPKPDGVFRILVLGDSFMEGYAVSDEDTFARQLEAVARQAGLENVDVMNMGMEGYGTLQSYLAYVEEGMSYDPDLVLLGFFASNDVQDNYRPLQDTLLGESTHTVTSRPFLSSWDQGEWVIMQPDYEGAMELYNRRERWSRWQKVRVLSLLGRAFATYWEEQEKSSRTGSSAALDDTLWAGVHYCEETPQYTEGWAVTEQILVELDGVVRESGAQLVVFTVPSREESDLEYAQQVINTLNAPGILCFEEGVANRRILSILERNHIPGIDLLPSFRSGVTEEGRVLFARDNHWNAEGYSLAAQAVFEMLSAEGFLPAH
jgi:hypothetical protein